MTRHYLRQIWSGLFTWDGIWPLTPEFSAVIALFLMFALGWIARGLE